MITDLKPYTAMKDSSVEWLGEVPEHWDVLPHRALFDEIKDRDCPDDQMLSVTIKRGVIKQASLLEDTSKKDSSNLDRSNYKLVQPGDVAYNKMRAWQGAIGVSDYRGIISPAYVVQRPRDGGEPRYFHQLFRIPSFAKEAERWSYGITSDMWSLRPEHFKLIYSCLPPLPEQAAIVRYLDHVDRRVRRLVRAKRKLIALLTEQKQAIIHRAVTRGLDPDVPLKDPGVEWLGEVPEHWEVRRVKEVTTLIEQGWSPQCDAQQADAEGWGVLKVGCVNHDEIDLTQNKRLPNSLQPRPEIQIRDGDILVSRANTRELLGLAALVVAPRPRLLLCDKLFRFRCCEGLVEPRFLVKVLRSRPSRDQIETQTNGASESMQNIGQGVIRNLVIAFPPFGEQQEISNRITSECVGMANTIAVSEREIELLNEYRTRLVADVVTGKVDVREAAAAMPEVDPLTKDDEWWETDEEDAVNEAMDEVFEEVDA